MVSGRFQLDTPQRPAAALARGRRALAALGPDCPVWLYGAELSAPAVVVGAYQNAAQALRAEAFDASAPPVVRRRTGGAAVLAAPGVLYAALALGDASALMACPPGRILNRNVRGLLAGVRGLGVPAHYFGRDFVSAAAEPFAYTAYTEAAGGRVLLEFFVGLDAAFALPPELDGYPERREPALRGKATTTLREKGATASPSAVLAAIAEGYEKAHGVTFERAAVSGAPASDAEAAVDLEAARRLTWSAPREDAIGFVSAGVALAGDERVRALSLCGDFFQHEACPEQLGARLIGQVPSANHVGAALDAVYGARPGLIEGIRSLNTLRDAILDAASRARATS
jgi:lipoate-protein ligase A